MPASFRTEFCSAAAKLINPLRKELVENHQLRAVISMPSGVFKPYAGVSTAVLIFTKTGAGGTENVWFYDMKADGFSLDDKRSEIEEMIFPISSKGFTIWSGNPPGSARNRVFLYRNRRSRIIIMICRSISTRKWNIFR